jgi:hypothetical protein
VLWNKLARSGFSLIRADAATCVLGVGECLHGHGCLKILFSLWAHYRFSAIHVARLVPSGSDSFSTYQRRKCLTD